MNNLPLVSIIIPNFETPLDDLRVCLDSILEQHYTNWECIIVDDGSSLNYKDYYKELLNHPSIRLIEGSNMGPSAARNIGVRSAKGDFICFCDADDILKKSFLQDAIEAVIQSDLDIFIGGTEVVSENGVNLVHRSNNETLMIFDSSKRQELINFTLAAQSTKTEDNLGNILLGRVYPKLISYKIAEKSLFDEDILIHEDNLWSIDSFVYSKKVGVSSRIYYSYKINPYSITHKSVDKVNLHKEIQFIQIVLDRYFKSYPEATIVRLLNTFIGIINMIASLELDNREIKHYLEQVLIIFQENSLDFKALNNYQLSKYKYLIATILGIKNISIKVSILRALIYYKQLK